MADQPRIQLEYDTSGAGKAAREFNKEHATVEKQAVRNQEAVEKSTASIGKSTEATAQGILRVVDTSKRSVQTLLASAERRVAGLRSPQDLLQVRQDSERQRVGGDVQARERLDAAHSAERQILKQRETNALLVDAQKASRQAAKDTALFNSELVKLNRSQAAAKQAAYDKSLDAASRASREAAKNADEFQRALARVNKEQRELRASTVASAERKVLSTKSPLEQLQSARVVDLKKVAGDPEAIRRITAAYNELEAAQKKQLGLLPQLKSAFGGVLGTLTAIGTAKFVLKDVILDSALYAARTEQLGVALNAVANANNISERTMGALEARLKSLGITTQETRGTLARLTAAQIDLSRAPELARAAQDLGRVAGIPSSDALEKLTHAIVTLQPELFRTLGLNVNLETAYERVAKAQKRKADSLTEDEKHQIALNEALDKAKAYAGVYANSVDTAGGQILSLDRYTQEFTLGLGNAFLPMLTKVTKGMGLFGKSAEEAGNTIGNELKSAGQTAIATLNPILMVYDLIDRVKGEYDSSKDRKEVLKEFRGKIDKQNTNALVTGAEKVKTDAAKRGAENDKKITEDREKRQKLAADAEKDRLSEVAQANKQSAAQLEDAIRDQLSPLDRLTREFEQKTAELKKLGKETGPAIDAERDLYAIRVTQELLRTSKEYYDDKAKASEKERDLRIKAEKDATATELQSIEELRAIRAEIPRQQLAIEQSTLEASHQQQLAGLESIAAVTVEQKIAVEQKKAAIDIDYVQQRLALQKRLLQIEFENEIESKKLTYEQTIALAEVSILREKKLDLEAGAEIDAAKQNASIKSTQIAQEQNQKTFDSFKRQAEGVFDALIRTSTDGWSAIANSLKTVLLTAMKDIVSSQVARVLFGLSGGGNVSFASGTSGAAGGGSGGGILGKILGFGGLGSVPVFGSGSLSGGPGGTGGFAGAVSGVRIPAALGGISTIPLNNPATTIGSGAAQNAGIFGGYAAQLKQYKTMLTNLGNLWKGHGVGGATGGALLAGGGILALDGVRRGGWLGLGETTAGGALIGAKFGGPVGAAIGAGIGFGVGLIGLFRESAEKKLIKKIKSLYGFDVESKFARDSLLPIIKQNFGGDIDAGLRAPQVRELLELYAMSRGLSSSGIVSRATPSVFAGQGGAFNQVPSFQNGAPVLAGSSQGIGAPQVINITIPGARQFFETETVQVLTRNPRQVNSASDAGQRQRGSREGAIALGSPSFVL